MHLHLSDTRARSEKGIHFIYLNGRAVRFTPHACHHSSMMVSIVHLLALTTSYSAIVLDSILNYASKDHWLTGFTPTDSGQCESLWPLLTGVIL